MYAFIPIRSAAGFGQVKTIKDFFYWVTGRYTNGAVHGGSFGDKDWPNFLKVSGEFFQILYKNFGPILIILAIAGLIYLFKKNSVSHLLDLTRIAFGDPDLRWWRTVWRGSSRSSPPG